MRECVAEGTLVDDHAKMQIERGSGDVVSSMEKSSSSSASGLTGLTAEEKKRARDDAKGEDEKMRKIDLERGEKITLDG